VNDETAHPTLLCVMCRKLKNRQDPFGGAWPPRFRLDRPFIRSTAFEAHHVLSKASFLPRWPADGPMQQLAARRVDYEVQMNSEIFEHGCTLACHDCCSTYLGDSPVEVDEVLLTVCREFPSTLYPLLAYAQNMSLVGSFGNLDIPREFSFDFARKAPSGTYQVSLHLLNFHR
jgi:hypothetical protein